MRRFIHLLSLCLIAFAVAQIFILQAYAVHASHPAHSLHPQSHRVHTVHTAHALKLQSMAFYYKLDAETRFLDLKTQWQGAHRGEIPMDKAKEFALQAYHASTMDTPFNAWRYQGGPAPLVFSAKAHIYGTGQKALLHVPFLVTVRAKVGDLRVITDLQLTDYQNLQATAQWITLYQQTIRVPAIAVGEDLLLPLMEFQMLDFYQKHPNQFPTQVEVRVSSPALGTVAKCIPLTPDHFVVPVLY